MRIFEIVTNIYDAWSSRPFLLGFRSVKHKSLTKRATREGWGRFPPPFFENGKKVPWFCKKSPLTLERRTLFVCIYGLKSYLKCNFKSMLEKKHQHFFLRGSSFVRRTWNVYRDAPIPKNLPCPKKFLVARLLTNKWASFPMKMWLPFYPVFKPMGVKADF